MPPQQADAASTDWPAFVSRLLFVGTADARKLTIPGEETRGSLTLSVQMKGHVGGGPVTDNLWVSADRSN